MFITGPISERTPLPSKLCADDRSHRYSRWPPRNPTTTGGSDWLSPIQNRTASTRCTRIILQNRSPSGDSPKRGEFSIDATTECSPKDCDYGPRDGLKQPFGDRQSWSVNPSQSQPKHASQAFLSDSGPILKIFRRLQAARSLTHRLADRCR